ncbi:MAG: hypothetical protein J6P30_07340 [Fibrobacter sp.]|nr:hypothetical protein [Fibrobacter sp.]
MVMRKFGMAVLLSLATIASASESGVLSYRAQRSLDAGKIAKSYGQLERALLASRKESDLRSEARVLMAMAQIRTMSLDFAFADSLLAQVREEILDKNTNLMLLQGKAALANAQEKFDETAKMCASADADSIKKADKPLQAAFFSECAIAQAAKRRTDDADESLKMVGKRSDKKGGFYAYTAARMADVSGRGEADSLYREAEKKSIQGNVPYMTATILYLRSQLKSTPADEVADLKLRCKNAFELMGLPNNAKRCGE